MSVTSLNGTTWILNDSPVYLPLTIQYYGMNYAQFNVSFTSNSDSFTKMTITTSSDIMAIEYKATNGLMVYATGRSPNWLDNAYKTITFTSSVTGGGTVPYGTEEDLIEWLEANATLVKDEVEISYKGSVIASMNASGTKTIETEATWVEDDILIEYTRPTAPTPALQSKTVSPSTSQQTVSPDSGYDGLSSVTVNAMPSGSAGTPTATKGTVSSNSVTITPSVTNVTGYITGGTKTGTAVTVSASELVSGTKSITVNGTGIDVTNYASVDVDVGGGGTPTLQSKSVTYSPSIVQQTDTVTADSGYDGLLSVNVTVDAVSRGTAGTPTATKGTVSNNSVSVTPSVTNVGGMIASGTKTGTAVTVTASELVSGTKNITSSGTTDVTNYASASVSAGTEGTPTATKGTVSNHSIAVIPRVTNTTGYITGGTKTGAAVTVFASELVSGTKSITENGTGIDVTNYTLVDVNVSGTPTLQSKTVTPSGSTLTVSPDTGYDGLSSVTVNPITLKMGVELPAAELVRSFTYDKKVVTDLSVNIPSYSTSAQTLVSSSALTPTVTLSLNSYAYYVLTRFLTIPVYNTATIAKGRNEYLYSSCAYEIVSIPANTFKAASGKLYANRNTTTLPVGALNKLFYWSSTSAVAVYNTAAYGCYQTPTAPSVSSASSATPTLTISAPAIGMRGHNTYLPSGVWSTITDIRCQYVIEVYRVPLSTYNYNGWGIYQQAEKIMDCADLSTRKLS